MNHATFSCWKPLLLLVFSLFLCIFSTCCVPKEGVATNSVEGDKNGDIEVEEPQNTENERKETRVEPGLEEDMLTCAETEAKLDACARQLDILNRKLTRRYRGELTPYQKVVLQHMPLMPPTEFPAVKTRERPNPPELDFVKMYSDPNNMPTFGIILYFFTIPCAPCDQLKPVIEKLTNFFPPNELLFVPILLYDEEDIADIEEDLERKFPIKEMPNISGIYLGYFGNDEAMNSVRDVFKGVPYVVHLDKNMKPLLESQEKYGMGISDPAKIKKYFLKIMKKKNKK